MMRNIGNHLVVMLYFNGYCLYFKFYVHGGLSSVSLNFGVDGNLIWY